MDKQFILLILVFLFAQKSQQQANVIDQMLLEQTITSSQIQHPTHKFQVTLPQRNSPVLARSQFYLVAEVEFTSIPETGKHAYFLELSDSVIEDYDVEKDYLSSENSNDFNRVWRQNKYRSTQKYFERNEVETPYYVGLHNRFQQDPQAEFKIKVYIKEEYVCANNCLDGQCLVGGCTCDKGYFDDNCSMEAQLLKENQTYDLDLKPDEWKFMYWPIQMKQNQREITITIESFSINMDYAIWIKQINVVEDFYRTNKSTSEKIEKTLSIENKQGIDLFIAVHNPSSNNEQKPFKVRIDYEYEEKIIEDNVLIFILIFVGIVIFFVFAAGICYYTKRKNNHDRSQQSVQPEEQQQQIPEVQEEQEVQNYDQHQLFPQNQNQTFDNHHHNNNNQQVRLPVFSLQDPLPLINHNQPANNLTRQETGTGSNKALKLGDYYDEKYKDNEKEIPQSTQCPICTISVLRSEYVVPVKCSHMFHAKCLVSWLKKNNTCPLCRVNLKEYQSISVPEI